MWYILKDVSKCWEPNIHVIFIRIEVHALIVAHLLYSDIFLILLLLESKFASTPSVYSNGTDVCLSVCLCLKGITVYGRINVLAMEAENKPLDLSYFTETRTLNSWIPHVHVTQIVFWLFEDFLKYEHWNFKSRGCVYLSRHIFWHYMVFFSVFHQKGDHPGFTGT